MIPLFAVIRVKRFRLWVPLFIVWLLLLPFALVLLPLMILACLAIRVNPWRALGTFWQVFTGMAGANIEVNDENAAVQIRIV